MAALLSACGGGGGGGGGSDTVAVPDGTSRKAAIRTTPESAGAQCTFAGTRVEVGVDADNNVTVDNAEVTPVAYVCNAANGAQSGAGSAGPAGPAGPAGAAGAND